MGGPVRALGRENLELRVKRGAWALATAWAGNNSVYRPGAILYLLHNHTFTPQNDLRFYNFGQFIDTLKFLQYSFIKDIF